MNEADRRRDEEARAAIRAARRLMELMQALRLSVGQRNKNGK